jgi:hypothetical protein
MIDMFKYYDTYNANMSRMTTYFSCDFIEVFDVYEQDKPENEQTRFGRTDEGEWLFVESSNCKPYCDYYDIIITAKTNESFGIYLEKQYQLYKRQNKLERILNYEKS